MERSILDSINTDDIWNRYIQRKDRINPNDPHVARYRELFADKECRRVIGEIADGTHVFSIPKKRMISKHHSPKKRTVYTFDEYEMMAMRLISSELYIYDGLFADNLYSFRQKHSVKDAIRRLSRDDLSGYYGYKTDIHDYFNSIDTDRLCCNLRKEIHDERLNSFFETILLSRKVEYNGCVIEESKGAMAGIPISAFLANFYLRDVDSFFSGQNCIYMRYADDILILSDDKERLLGYRESLIKMIGQYGLEINPDKDRFFSAGESFDFLGFSISHGDIDISMKAVRKMKGKIRRSARSIRRWMLKNNAPLEGTIRAMIRTYDRKFFGYGDDELTWALWYLPVITTDRSLRIIDRYLQDWIRYIVTGRHNKKNYDVVPYELMVRNGYRTLVNEYYNGKR